MAVAAARQGAKVSFLGKVGNEADSCAVSAFCEKEGIAPVVYYSDPSVVLAMRAVWGLANS